MRARLPVILYFVCICAFGARCFGQAQAPQFASSFASLDRLTIDNVLMIVDPGAPMVVVLARRDSGKEIYLFSLSKGQSRLAWHLSQFPPSMEAISPRNLKVEYGDAGPVITLHGCAGHLCGGEGSAGAFTYSVATGKMCSALASWDNRAKRANISYSCPDGTLTGLEKSLLVSMLKEEGY